MTYTTNALDDARDAVLADILSSWGNGKIGTDSTAPTPADADLGASVLTKVVNTASGGVGFVTHSFSVTSAEANGNSLVEAGFFDAVPTDMFGRWTFVAIAKTVGIEVSVSCKTEVSVTEV
jgi:hypothetical protein